MRGVALRNGRPDDGEALAAVFGAARSEMRYLPALHTSAQDVAYFSEDVLPGSRVVVAEADGEMVGFSAVRAGWLEHLYVAPGWQGRGVGGSLLDRAMTEHPGGLSLWAFAANTRAIALYGRAGFVEVERTDGSRNEERVPDVQMRWRGGLKE
jgi:GNAT superfamily N-acetyltransferase